MTVISMSSGFDNEEKHVLKHELNSCNEYTAFILHAMKKCKIFEIRENKIFSANWLPGM